MSPEGNANSKGEGKSLSIALTAAFAWLAVFGSSGCSIWVPHDPAAAVVGESGGGTAGAGSGGTAGAGSGGTAGAGSGGTAGAGSGGTAGASGEGATDPCAAELDSASPPVRPQAGEYLYVAPEPDGNGFPRRFESYESVAWPDGCYPGLADTLLAQVEHRGDRCWSIQFEIRRDSNSCERSWNALRAFRRYEFRWDGDRLSKDAESWYHEHPDGSNETKLLCTEGVFRIGDATKLAGDYSCQGHDADGDLNLYSVIRTYVQTKSACEKPSPTALGAPPENDVAAIEGTTHLVEMRENSGGLGRLEYAGCVEWWFDDTTMLPRRVVWNEDTGFRDEDTDNYHSLEARYDLDPATEPQP